MKLTAKCVAGRYAEQRLTPSHPMQPLIAMSSHVLTTIQLAIHTYIETIDPIATIIHTMHNGKPVRYVWFIYIYVANALLVLLHAWSPLRGLCDAAAPLLYSLINYIRNVYCFSP